MNAPKWTEYPQGQVLEKDLPPGVKYTWAGTGEAEFVAADCNKKTCVRWVNNAPCHAHLGSRGNNPVTILDWPDHCGPRPDTGHPTYGQVVKNAPSRDAYVVFCHSGGGKEFIKTSAFSCGGTSRTVGKVLGYLEFPEP